MVWIRAWKSSTLFPAIKWPFFWFSAIRPNEQTANAP
ncbi:hypothetical protein SAMN05446635_0777 [Burkholderia sp. OK233]|nr:hypothetical protein SAMN05446635_0777 [Burkholderia sp. OK233]